MKTSPSKVRAFLTESNSNNEQENNLPAGWVWSSLEDCVEILDSQRIPINATERAQRIERKSKDERYPYYGATGQVGWIDDFIFDEELLLLGEDGAPFLESTKDKAYIIRGKSWVNNHAHVLRAISGLTTNHYLMHYLNYADYHDFVTGTTRLKLNQSRMRKIPIPLAPFSEQERMVAKIEKLFSQLDAGIVELDRIQANLARYKASVLKAACEGRLVPTEAELARAERRNYETGEELLRRILDERKKRWEEEQRAKGKDPSKMNYREPEAPNTEGLPELPEGWVWATVEQLGAVNEQPVLTGPFGSNLGSNDFVESGVPVLTIGSLSEQGLDLRKAKYISESKASELNRYRVREGDLLFSRMATVGRAGLVTPQYEGTIINYHLMRLRLSKHAIEPTYFISYVRGSDTVTDYVGEVNHGATRDGINTKQLLSMPVALPPIAEQFRIIEEVEQKLSVVQKMEAVTDANLKRAERLRQAILKRAFEGKLVTQDAEDEPASRLLEPTGTRRNFDRRSRW
jgi:type I restriction enzyme S subunit